MKHTGEKRPSRKWLLAAISGSLLLHALMMLVPYSQKPTPADTGLAIRLVSPAPVSQPKPEHFPEQKSLPQQETMVEPLASEPPSANPDTPMVTPIVVIPTPASQESTEEPPVTAVSTEPFSQQVLASVRQMHGEMEIPEGRDTLQAHPVPALPDQPGWLNDYVGTVESRIERWQNADGSHESRSVLANGLVICGRTQAPTPFELFNPQFSINIMTFSVCGRERPEPVDRTDPWLRGGPESESE